MCIMNLAGNLCIRGVSDTSMLILYYKIAHGLTPSFLTDLLPPSVGTRTRYNQRNDPNLTGFAARTETFKRSFFPSTTHLWNKLYISNLEFLSIITLNILLFGSDDQTVEQNVEIAVIVHNYINDTGRFA